MVHHRLLLWLGLVVVVASGLVPLPPPPAPVTQLYIGHSARLTAEIPSAWTVDPAGRYDYSGRDGFIVSFPVSGQTLAGVCSAGATSPVFDDRATVSQTTWQGQPACRLGGTSDGNAAEALVVAHPHPFTFLTTHYSYAALLADSVHFPSIIASLDFSPDRVSPSAFILSVIDLIQARAYWADQIDWSLVRQQALAEVNGLSSIEMAQGALLNVIQWLRAAGDNHSFILLPNETNALAEATGYGLLVGGQRVLAVFPGGPADRVGVRPGDIITAVDGQPFRANLDAVDPAMLATINSPDSWPVSAHVTLQRTGLARPIMVTIPLGPYSRYLAPTGRQLPGNIGYLAVPHFLTAGREAAYVTAAQDIATAIDQAPTCGWVIDLRLNDGGSYSPMVTAVGPILGNGIFVGWRYRDGRQTWVTYQDGRIDDNGRRISNYANGQPYTLHQPHPPVAVLIGPMTASSGEVTTLAFVGRTDTRLFGEPTAGRTTANQTFSPYDGTRLALAVAAMTDRTGATHMSGIKPDQRIATNWATFGTGQDPVLTAAQAWLHQQPACRQATPATF